LRKMDLEPYFNLVYDDTCGELMKFIVMKTNNADQAENIFQNVYKSF
jgi:hypothetical protein